MMSGHQKRQKKNVNLSLLMQLTIQNSPSYLLLVSKIIRMVTLNMKMKTFIQKYPRLIQQKLFDL